MNYGGDAADQIVRYSMEGMEHTLRISGSIAKNLAVFIVAVLKDQKKTYGKTQMVRMIKERRPTKFFTVPDDRMEGCSNSMWTICLRRLKKQMTITLINQKIILL